MTGVQVGPPVAGQDADDVSERVVAAAIELLEAGGADRFESPNIASQAGLDPATVTHTWPDRLQLLMAAWTRRLGWRDSIIDTGGLRDDLLGFGESVRQGVRTPQSRMLFRSSLPIDGTDEFTEVRREFWDAQFDTAKAIADRAFHRGELRGDVDPLDVIRMFCTALYFDTLYLNETSAPEYLASVVDILLRGVAIDPPGDSAAMRGEVFELVGTGLQDALGEEQPRPNYTQATTAQIRRAILDAAIKETTLRGPDLVTRSTIARRVGVTIQVVERMWKSDADLLLDAGARVRERTRPVPDSGSLWQDLLAFTDAKAGLISTADARKNYVSAILLNPTGRNAALLAEFWLAGLRESTQICFRAQDRGEIRRGVDPDHATRILVVALYYDLFFVNSPMRPDYAFTVLDVFLNGAAGLGPGAGAESTPR